jgi:chemotaxis methyl-accepting protein methylase
MDPADTELSGDEQSCLEWLLDRAGLDLRDYRRETIKRRIASCLRALRVETPGQLRKLVQRRPDLMKVALSSLIIGVSSFFRDPTVFEHLSGLVLPELTARSQDLRIWSAGCSDGAELYSVAMLLAERGAIQRACLLGTDCRSDALARAREGCYDGANVKNVPAEFLRRYFQFDSTGWHVHPYLRSITQWRTGNVLTTLEPGLWDLVLCRNVAIYMYPAAATMLWQRLEQCLRPGGFLVLGKAERPQNAIGLKLVAPCIYRRNRS